MANKKIISHLSLPTSSAFFLSHLFSFLSSNCSNPKPQIQLYLIYRLSFCPLYHQQTRIRHIFSRAAQSIASGLAVSSVLPFPSSSLSQRFCDPDLRRTVCFWNSIRHQSRNFDNYQMFVSILSSRW